MKLTKQFYYFLSLHMWGERFETEWDQKGSISADPVALYKNQVTAREREWFEEFNEYPERSGLMFALWGFDFKPELMAAQTHARNAPPDVIYMNSASTSWALVPFALHPDVRINFKPLDQL